MKRAILYTVVLLLPALMALPSAQMSSAGGAKVKVSHTVVAATGAAAPAGGNYSTFSFFNATLNARHAVAFDAFVIGPHPTTGVFVGDGKTTSTIALGANPDPAAPSFGFVFNPFITPNGDVVFDDNVVPTGGRFTSFHNPVINDRGQVAFVAEMTGGSADFGLFRGEGGDLTPVFVANQMAPGGATIEDFGDPVINRHGQVAVIGLLTNSASRRGVFVGDGTDAVAIALDGQLAPKGGSYTDSGRGAFPGPIRLNDRGEVAFDARLTGGTSLSGIFRGDGDRTTTIALAGTIAPGTTGTFESFGDIKLGNDGRVAFIATLAVGVGGVDSSNNMGIWIGTSDEDLQLVVRTSEVIGGNVLTLLPQFGFASGNQFDMNENGLLWIGNFGPAKAIVFSRILGENDDVDIP